MRLFLVYHNNDIVVEKTRTAGYVGLASFLLPFAVKMAVVEISSKRTNTIAKVLAELSPQRLGLWLRFVARWNRIDEEMCAPPKSE